MEETTHIHLLIAGVRFGVWIQRGKPGRLCRTHGRDSPLFLLKMEGLPWVEIAEEYEK